MDYVRILNENLTRITKNGVYIKLTSRVKKPNRYETIPYMIFQTDIKPALHET
jgi:hypothetical protein